MRKKSYVYMYYAKDVITSTCFLFGNFFQKFIFHKSFNSQRFNFNIRWKTPNKGWRLTEKFNRKKNWNWRIKLQINNVCHFQFPIGRRVSTEKEKKPACFFLENLILIQLCVFSFVAVFFHFLEQTLFISFEKVLNYLQHYLCRINI